MVVRTRFLGRLLWIVTIAAVAMPYCGHPAAKPHASLIASPNPVMDCDGDGLGQTTLAWFREGFGTVEVRIGSPEGALFATTGAFGHKLTGDWVKDGLEVYLLDAAGRSVLAETKIFLTRVGCS